MPAFVYLIPAVALFGPSRFTAIVASVIYAAPPVIRLVDVGIRSVSADGHGGGHRRRLDRAAAALVKVQLPLSRERAPARGQPGHRPGPRDGRHRRTCRRRCTRLRRRRRVRPAIELRDRPRRRGRASCSSASCSTGSARAPEGAHRRTSPGRLRRRRGPWARSVSRSSKVVAEERRTDQGGARDRATHRDRPAGRRDRDPEPGPRGLQQQRRLESVGSGERRRDAPRRARRRAPRRAPRRARRRARPRPPRPARAPATRAPSR